MTSALSRRDVILNARLLGLATPFLGLIACDGAAGRKSTVVSGATMGTTYSVTIPSLPMGVDRADLERDIAGILDGVNRRMSTYRPESELSRYNAAGSATRSEVSADTLAVVEEALAVSRLTGGAFDPTIGPLVGLWGFGADGGRRAVPSADAIDTALRNVGYGEVLVGAGPPRLGKGCRAVRVDLSGIAKGFGVDKVAEQLERKGIEYYLVEVGGELRGRGYSRRGELWRVGIERPRAPRGSVQRVVRLGGQALATSGDYRIFFEEGGKRYSHIIDPRSGRPVDHGLASVTVIASSTMRADALSTALMVMGPTEGLALARRDGIAAYFLAKTERGLIESASPEFTRYLIA